MKKKFKARKTKNIAEKTGQSNCYRFGVNPLIKQELLQLLKETNKNTEDNAETYPVWKNFEVPPDFTLGLRKLAQHMDVYDNMMLNKYIDKLLGDRISNGIKKLFIKELSIDRVWKQSNNLPYW